MFYIGFAKSKLEPTAFEGYAWVTAGPVAVTGGHAFNTYGVISSYALGASNRKRNAS